MSNETLGVLGGAALAVMIFGWWGVFVVALWALAACAETKSGRNAS